MKKITKNLLLGAAAVYGSTFQAVACTGISLTARDGSYVQARTIEWSRGVLQSEYVIIPRGEQLTSFTPTGTNGLTFTAKYGVVGLTVVQKEFICRGVSDKGGAFSVPDCLIYFPRFMAVRVGRYYLHKTFGKHFADLHRMTERMLSHVLILI